MTDTKHASEYKPMIEIGTVIFQPNFKRYKRWDGDKWVDVTEEMKKRENK